MTATSPPPQPADAKKAAAKKAALKSWIRAIDAIKILNDQPDAILPVLFDQIAARYADKPALIGEASSLTYHGLSERAGRYAEWALARRLAPGEVVCLLMPNCPDYVAIWFGLTRIGCVVALLNTNLMGAALAHCIAAADGRHIIVSETLAANLPPLSSNMRYWTPDKMLRQEASEHRDDPKAVAPRQADTALLIYTSGTTGLPKAARITHGRLIEWSYWFAGMMDAAPTDRLYNCLPMYHSVGGVIAVGAMLVAGGSVIIRERFSASRFWDDVANQGCTIFQYIGELCRYLTQCPPHPREAAHQLRLACGNGLAGGVWEDFQARFRIPQILEYYAATEGNVSLYNVEGKPGAIGRVPPFLSNRFAIALIRCDAEGEALRDDDGFCIRCEADEAGEAIGKIAEAASAFDGYTDPAASRSKILTGAFERGDRWFRTGDLMRRDRAGYYYFVDRLGDTFRWKGENVSTTQVAAVVSACTGIGDAVVFGVFVPGQEGRAGMAAITTAADFSLAALHTHLAANLPAYAQPLFIRICETLTATGTFKLQKAELRREGYAASPDPVFYNQRREKFIPFTGHTLDL